MSTFEQVPVRQLLSEAEAIAAAKEIAVEIAAIAADSSQNGQLPWRQAQPFSPRLLYPPSRESQLLQGIALDVGH